MSVMEDRAGRALAALGRISYARPDHQAQVDWLGSLIANAGFGVVLATHESQIIYANGAAEALMRLRRGLCCQQGRITTTSTRTTQKLQALISGASLPPNQALSGGSMILSGQNGEALFAVHVVPVSAKSSGRLTCDELPVAGLFIVDRNPEAATCERVDIFASLFGLTRAESRVLAALVSGKGLISAAERLEMAELTARTHLKHILAKTDTHRQAELMRLFFEVTIPRERTRSPQSEAHRSSIKLPNRDRNQSPVAKTSLHAV